MASFPALESLFVLSDDVSMISMRPIDEMCDGRVEVVVPHGFLSAKGVDLEEHEFPQETAH